MLALGKITKAELLEYRRLNDVTFAGWATERRSDEDIRLLEENLERMASLLDDSDAFIRCDTEFHRLIAAAGKNGFAVIVAGVISGVVLDMLHTDFAEIEASRGRRLREGVLKLHTELFEAIRRRDSENARKIAMEHMLDFENDFKSR